MDFAQTDLDDTVCVTAWMSTQAGYNDRELARAMGSTKAARFEVLVVNNSGS